MDTIQCSHCKNNIRKKDSWLIDLLLHNDLIYIGLLLISMPFLHTLFKYVPLTIVGALTIIVSYIMTTNYFTPLSKATKDECEGIMTRTGAIISLIAIPIIIIMTLYILVYKSII